MPLTGTSPVHGILKTHPRIQTDLHFDPNYVPTHTTVTERTAERITTPLQYLHEANNGNSYTQLLHNLILHHVIPHITPNQAQVVMQRAQTRDQDVQRSVNHQIFSGELPLYTLLDKHVTSTVMDIMEAITIATPVMGVAAERERTREEHSVSFYWRIVGAGTGGSARDAVTGGKPDMELVCQIITAAGKPNGDEWKAVGSDLIQRTIWEKKLAVMEIKPPNLYAEGFEEGLGEIKEQTVCLFDRQGVPSYRDRVPPFPIRACKISKVLKQATSQAVTRHVKVTVVSSIKHYFAMFSGNPFNGYSSLVVTDQIRATSSPIDQNMANSALGLILGVTLYAIRVEGLEHHLRGGVMPGGGQANHMGGNGPGGNGGGVGGGGYTAGQGGGGGSGGNIGGTGSWFTASQGGTSPGDFGGGTGAGHTASLGGTGSSGNHGGFGDGYTPTQGGNWSGGSGAGFDDGYTAGQGGNGSDVDGGGIGDGYTASEGANGLGGDERGIRDGYTASQGRNESGGNGGGIGSGGHTTNQEGYGLGGNGRGVEGGYTASTGGNGSGGDEGGIRGDHTASQGENQSGGNGEETGSGGYTASQGGNDWTADRDNQSIHQGSTLTRGDTLSHETTTTALFPPPTQFPLSPPSSYIDPDSPPRAGTARVAPPTRKVAPPPLTLQQQALQSVLTPEPSPESGVRVDTLGDLKINLKYDNIGSDPLATHLHTFYGTLRNTSHLDTLPTLYPPQEPAMALQPVTTITRGEYRGAGSLWTTFGIKECSVTIEQFGNGAKVLKMVNINHFPTHIPDRSINRSLTRSEARLSILHELRVYQTELEVIQGVVVPRCYGMFGGLGTDPIGQDRDASGTVEEDETWMMVIEDAGHPILDQYQGDFRVQQIIREQYRQLHAAGVLHNDVSWDHILINSPHLLQDSASTAPAIKLIDFDTSITKTSLLRDWEQLSGSCDAAMQFGNGEQQWAFRCQTELDDVEEMLRWARMRQC